MSKPVEIEQVKGQQTTLWICDPDWKHSGISITLNKKNRSFYVSGWYDSFVGIDGAEIKLDDFIELFAPRQSKTSKKG